MKKSLFLAVSVAAVSFHLTAGEAAAQRAAGPEVAIIDLGYIFKNHVRFKMMTDDLRADVDQAEADIKAAKGALEKLAQGLESYRKGSAEYKSLEEEVARRSSDLNLQIKVQKRNFVEQEAKNLYSVYQEMVERVKYYADQNGVALVLQFNGDPIEQIDAPGVQSQLNRMVVYYNRAIDITPIILEELNASVPRRPAAPVGPSTGPRQGVPLKR
ncbi:MAG: OmpH family outer membrane protein [Pirellulales bacterium]